MKDDCRLWTRGDAGVRRILLQTWRARVFLRHLACGCQHRTMAGSRLFSRFGDARQYSCTGWFVCCSLAMERSEGQDQQVIRAPINPVELTETQPTALVGEVRVWGGWVAVAHFYR